MVLEWAVHGIESEEHNSLDQVDERSSIHIPLRECEHQTKGCPRVVDKSLREMAYSARGR